MIIIIAIRLTIDYTNTNTGGSAALPGPGGRRAGRRARRPLCGDCYDML